MAPIFRQDLRYSLRTLLKRPGFTLVVALTLALSIGANATIFTWIKAVLLQPLPGIERPEELVEIWGATRNNSALSSSYLDYLDFRDRNEVFSGLIAHQVLPLNLGRGAKPERVWGGRRFGQLLLRARRESGDRTYLYTGRRSHSEHASSCGHWPPIMAASLRRRSERRRTDHNMPVYDVKTLDEHTGVSHYLPQMAAALLSAFGLLALLLAAIGLYGVMSYSVGQRMREIGIRVSLGAQRRDVLRLVMEQGLTLSLIGIVIGLAAALAVTRLITHLLYGVSPTDPATFGLIALLLVGVAIAACYIPARRATKVDPMIALRNEG